MYKTWKKKKGQEEALRDSELNFRGKLRDEETFHRAVDHLDVEDPFPEQCAMTAEEAVSRDLSASSQLLMQNRVDNQPGCQED